MRFSSLFLLIFGLAFGGFSSPKAHASYCDSEAVKSLDLPLYPGDPSRAQETFRYVYSQSLDGDGPLVVVLPGGPGQGAMSIPIGIPTGFPVLRIDPRGVGCNARPESPIPADALGSEFVASDVVAVIKTLNRPYILYGASYGTLVATIVAAKLGQGGGPAPIAMVLEAPLGRAFVGDEYLSAFLKRWKKIQSRLPAPVREELSRSPLPFDKSPEEWGNYILSLFYTGIPSGGTEEDIVQQLSLLQNPAMRPFLAKRIGAAASPPNSDRLRVFREVTCREITNQMRGLQFDVELRDGKLIPVAPGFCGDIPMDRPFDSALYPLKVPIYYFVGSLDPALPPEQTRYHFNHQKGAPRALVLVPGAGHMALSGNLGGCKSKIWEAMARNDRAELTAALATCKSKPFLDLADPHP